MDKYRIDEITVNLDNLRKPLNNSERNKISKKKLYPYYGANNLMDYVDEYIFDEEILCIAEDGGSWGYKEKCSYIVNEKCWVNNHAHVLKAKDNLNLKYLNYYLNYNDLNSKITGTTRGKLTKSALNSIEVFLPNLTEQNRIVNVLNKSQELIGKRKEQIEALDELVKSKFIEMFGDPINNPKNFELLTVDDIIGFQGGSQPDKKYFEYKKTDDNIRLIQIRDYKTDAYITYIPKTMAKRFCDADDIMIGRYGPPIFQILKGIEGSYNVALMKATPKKGNKEFVRQFLKQECLFNYLDGLSQRTAGQSGIDMPKLKQYPFPYPPIELQNQFADFLKQIDKLKFEMQKSLTQLEQNFNSLIQRGFKGELFD